MQSRGGGVGRPLVSGAATAAGFLSPLAGPAWLPAARTLSLLVHARIPSLPRFLVALGGCAAPAGLVSQGCSAARVQMVRARRHVAEGVRAHVSAWVCLPGVRSRCQRPE